jgi:hypothetical protein
VVNRHQAHRDIPLAMHPNWQPVWADDPRLDVDWRERRRQIKGALIGTAVVAIAVLLMALAGGGPQ